MGIDNKDKPLSSQGFSNKAFTNLNLYVLIKDLLLTLLHSSFNKCSDRSIGVLLPTLLGNYDQQTGMKVKEVTLLIRGGVKKVVLLLWSKYHFFVDFFFA